MEFNNVKDTCGCPIPCERLVYEPVISYASSSNFDIDALLRQSSTEDLQAKYVRAREINQKVDQSTVMEDTKQITKFIQNVIKMASAMDKITDVLQSTEDSIEASFHSLVQRINIHMTKALEQIEYIIDHSFVSGWEEFKQKTFHMIVHDYEGLAMSLKRGIKEAEKTFSPENEEIRQLVYLPIETKLRRRRQLVDETVEFLKIVNRSYEFVIPIKPLPGRRYDEAYLSEELMLYNEVNLVEYVYNTAQYEVRTHQMRMLIKTVEMMYSGLDELLQVGDNYVLTGEFDAGLFKYGYKNFTNGANNFNYRLFMFENRVILVHKLLMESKITELKLHNRTLGEAFMSVKRMTDDIKFSILSSKDEYWKEILHIKDLSEKYLNNPNAYKTPLAKMVTSKQVDVSVQTIHSFFSNILLKIEDLQKEITSLHQAYEVVWKTIISEQVTKKFYRAVYDDMQQLKKLKDDLYGGGMMELKQLKATTTAMNRKMATTIDHSLSGTTVETVDKIDQDIITTSATNMANAPTDEWTNKQHQSSQTTEEVTKENEMYTTLLLWKTTEKTTESSGKHQETAERKYVTFQQANNNMTEQPNIYPNESSGVQQETTELPTRHFKTAEQDDDLKTTISSVIHHETTELPTTHYTTTEQVDMITNASPKVYHEKTDSPTTQYTTTEPVEEMFTTSQVYKEDILPTTVMPEMTMSTMDKYNEILKIFSSLLLDDFPTKELNYLSLEELSSRINGDIFSMNLSSVLNNLENEFSILSERIAEMSQVAESDKQFMTSFESYRRSLQEFMDRNQINPKFYRYVNFLFFVFICNIETQD